MLRTAAVLLAFCLALSGAARGQAAPAATQAPTDTAAAAAQTAPPPAVAPAASADTGRVTVPQPSEKAVRYFRSGNVLWVVGTLWGLLLPALLLFTGLSARIRTGAQRLGKRWFWTVALYGIAITLLLFIIDLPLAWYTDFVREHAYGLSNQSFGKWMGDQLKAVALGVVSTVLVLWIPYLLLRKSPRRWWLWTGLAFTPLIVITIWLQPMLIDPMFNHFGPMHDKVLEQKILALAQRAGIEGGRVYEVKKSEDTNSVNAYVTGFGSSKRIVLWDTILRKMDDRELLFVMGHEMGHYVLKHVLMTLAFIILGMFLSLYAIHLTAGWMIARWGRRFGFSDLADVASYPLLILILSVVTLAAQPALLAWFRHQEHEADRFGLELTRDNHHAATAFVKLQSENLSVPYHSTLYKLWNDSHPPLGERIEFANDYHPWREGRPLRYGSHFK